MRRHLQRLAERSLADEIENHNLLTEDDEQSQPADRLKKYLYRPDSNEAHVIETWVQARDDNDFLLHTDLTHPNEESSESVTLLLNLDKPDFSSITKAIERIIDWKPA